MHIVAVQVLLRKCYCAVLPGMRACKIPVPGPTGRLDWLHHKNVMTCARNNPPYIAQRTERDKTKTRIKYTATTSMRACNDAHLSSCCCCNVDISASTASSVCCSNSLAAAVSSGHTAKIVSDAYVQISPGNISDRCSAGQRTGVDNIV